MHNRSLVAALILALSSLTHADSQETPSMTKCASLVNENKLAEAEAFCVQAAVDAPGEGKVMYGDFLFRKGDARAAIQQYTELLKDADMSKPSNVELASLSHRAMVQFQSGNGTKAIDDIEKFLKHRPEDVEMLRLAFQATPWHDRREEYAGRLLALAPGEMEFHLMRIHAFIRSGKGKEAVEAADAALKLDPKSNFALTWRGFAHAAQGDFIKAERDHATVARRLPKETDPRANQAQVLLELKRYADAIEVASEALALKPDHFEGLKVRAQARLNMGDGEGALADIQTAKRVSPQPFASEIELYAPELIATHAAMSRESVARMEADRKLILEAIEGHMHGKCGNYRVPDYEDNANLNAYRDCILSWSRTGEEVDLTQELHSSVVEAAERFYEFSRRLEAADGLRCSKMPKKSRCIDDSLYARASAADAGMDYPMVLVGQAEWNRLNYEVDVYNGRLKRQEALSKTASFLDALANALSEQSQQ
jgi:tetratricopeptide (TPR) repeat protein